MTRLGSVISEAIVHHYGRDEMLRRLEAKLGQQEEIFALKRLDDQARRLERHATGPDVEDHIRQERETSHAYGGRSIFGDEPPDTV